MRTATQRPLQLSNLEKRRQSGARSRAAYPSQAFPGRGRNVADETEILEEDDAPAPSTAEESSALAEKLSALKARCDAANIEFLQKEDDEGKAYATISVPAGRSKRQIFVFSERKAATLLDIGFEKYRFISGYDAICSYEHKYIEVSLSTTRTSPRFILQRLLNKPIEGDGAESESQSLELTPPDSLHDRPTLEIGPPSGEFVALVGGFARFCLKLKGVKATYHDQAMTELRSYADSVFFQIDMLYGSTFTLRRERSVRLSPPNRRQAGPSLVYAPSKDFQKCSPERRTSAA
jgi:hypothetical protein